MDSLYLKDNMKYVVRSRNVWDHALHEQFGDDGDIHDLSGDDVVQAIIKHGRAAILINERFSIQDDDPPMILEFQNDYD